MTKKLLKNINIEIEKFVEQRLVDIITNANVEDELIIKLLQINTQFAVIKVDNKNSKSNKTNMKNKILSGYLLYCQDKRDELKQNNPELRGKHVITELGRLWKCEDEEIKLEYNNKSKELKNILEIENPNILKSNNKSKKYKQTDIKTLLENFNKKNKMLIS
jgi:hypothetical protein